ncbi:Dam family site-specific DNA-(adenine-N6)-methyltransferase [Candidatus Enterococcus leclercqii]|uniref:Dam family site-specific DNA-(adenine-N6)-methyltransferase n=1 Tax=Candidatus Enterococcus leclercqii TaxID=1857218 RepID=UPI00137A374E|nr:Dam family site-specific DNA-(adenine-N6)-methyltransferase [Enterococcus sp. CU9D]KAF1293544.1 DNA adenine methylase [Enterococcus sp. CU9D]
MEKNLKPILKWAGGKTQMLQVLHENMPRNYNKYIEPFIGGGALYFSEQAEKAIISDSNEELINLYEVVANDVEKLISELGKYYYDKDFYYEVRSLNTNGLSNIERAARTVFLNRTGFNGLYRVNKKGEFNVPFGKYKNPKILDAVALRAASQQLQRTNIYNSDYKEVLREYAEPGDFIFLDPPYMPISEYSDFKRYTKEQFGLNDQRELAIEVKRLTELGCYVMLTNSAHPLILDLYKDFDIQVFETKRMINSNAAKRTGQDIIVKNYSGTRKFASSPVTIPEQNNKFPSTRYMGSKEKLLSSINGVVSNFDYDSVLDLFSGSGSVSYLFKTLGKQVFSNDYMTFSSNMSKATVENNNVTVTGDDIDKMINTLPEKLDTFVSETFKGLYFSDEDNNFIDLIRTNMHLEENEYKRSIILAALTRACLKKRPRGIFTYTGNRYNDGRRDLKLTLQDQFLEAVYQINESIFDNGKENRIFNEDALTLECDADLVYIDPPYFSPLSDNEYVRRYHFVEGLAKNWKNVEMQWDTKTKKFKNYPTAFSTKKGTYEAFDQLFKKYSNKIVVVSYSSNSLPNKQEMMEIMSRYFSNLKIIEVDYKYSFGNHKHKVGNNKNDVLEYLFVGY